MADGQVPAGWYPDPAGDTSKIRYWDGAAWTAQTQPSMNPDLQASAASTSYGASAEVSPTTAATSAEVYTGAAVTQQPSYTNSPVTSEPVYTPDQGIPVYSVTKQASTKNKGFAIASLVLGIIGILICCLAYVAAVPGILAVIFGILGLKSDKKGVAIAGIICGAIAIVLAVAMSVFGVLVITNPTQYGLPADIFSQYGL